MQGDVLEICLAAFRGDQLFVDQLKPQLHRDGLTLPNVSEYFIQRYKFLHTMDANLVTGRLKWDDQKAVKLFTHMPFVDSPCVQMWTASQKTKNQGICLACIFEFKCLDTSVARTDTARITARPSRATSRVFFFFFFF